jgi:hypothetical protein
VIKKQSGHMDFGLLGWILTAVGFLLSPAGLVPLVITLLALGYFLFSAWRQYRRVGSRFSFYQVQFELVIVGIVCATAWLTTVGTLFDPVWLIPAMLTATPVVAGFWPMSRGGYEGMGRMLLVILCLGAAVVSWVTFGLGVWLS